MRTDLFEALGLGAVALVLVVLILGAASWLWRLGQWLEKPRPGDEDYPNDGRP